MNVTDIFFTKHVKNDNTIALVEQTKFNTSNVIE